MVLNMKNSLSKKKYMSFILFVIGNSSCVADDQMKSEIYELKEVLLKENEFDGQMVTLLGFYVQEKGYAILFPDRESYKIFTTEYAIWIGPDSSGSKTSRKNKIYAKIRGNFSAEDLGHFGMFKGQLNPILNFEPWERSTKSK